MSQILNSPSKGLRHLSALFFLVLSLHAGSGLAQGACNYDELLKINITLLDNYQFIKSFPVETNKQTEKVEYTYMMNGGTNYRLIVVDNGKAGERMMVTLRDRAKKVVASNKDKQKKIYLKQIDFVCPATGIYYFEMSFEEERKDCGLMILGYQK